MGFVGRSGAASFAHRYYHAAQYRSFVSVGMAFGVDRAVQQPGEILVSERLFPYDDRTTTDVAPWRARMAQWLGLPAWQDEYTDRDRTPIRASNELLALFRRAADARSDLRVSFGTFATGSARVQSRAFRDHVLEQAMRCGAGPIIGGDMEALALLTLPERRWAVVKAIGDFADGGQASDVARNRALACARAAQFVLGAIVSRPRPQQAAASPRG
jgi:nucleoside phosphorylase